MLTDRLKLIRHRARAYREVFRPDGKMSQWAKVVMLDLAEYCRDGRSSIMVSHKTGQVDPLATVAAATRREVFDRIKGYADLTDRDLMDAKREAQDEQERMQDNG